MKKYIRSILTFTVSFFTLFGIVLTDDPEEITISELKKHISTLASEEYEGRLPGSAGDSLSAAYISKQFQQAGLKTFGGSYYQYFDVVVKVKPGEENFLQVNGVKYQPGEDFVPFPLSADGGAEAEAVFAGYGFNINEDSLQWDDYKGIDVEGKWLLLLMGDPEPDKSDSKFLEYSEIRNKILTARDKKALGILFVSGPNFDEEDELVSMTTSRVLASAGIPVFHIKRSTADDILKSSGKSVSSLEKALNESRSPASFKINAVINASANLERVKVKTQNIIGLLEGADKNSFLVIGAHYDHLGYGGEGSGSRNPDTTAVHHGADDNASGVAALIELSEKFYSVRDELQRSIIFAAFGAEEKGLIGSKFFADNMQVDKKSIFAMINMDMLGRLDTASKSLTVGGYGTAAEYQSIFNELDSNNDNGLNLNFNKEGYGPSDHASFYAENIPVLFFSTGAHQDYHLPEDEESKINYKWQKKISDFIYKTALKLVNYPGLLTYKEAGPKVSMGHGRRFKVTLGIMPDFAKRDVEGLGVGGVREGGPAENGGMKKGDIITAVNGKPVKNIYDYMYRLKELKPGETINVDIIRNGEKKVLLIQL